MTISISPAPAPAAKSSSSSTALNQHQNGSSTGRAPDPVIPPINAYGTFPATTNANSSSNDNLTAGSTLRHRPVPPHRTSSGSSCSSIGSVSVDERTKEKTKTPPTLAPSAPRPPSHRLATELIPFSSMGPVLAGILRSLLHPFRSFGKRPKTDGYVPVDDGDHDIIAGEEDEEEELNAMDDPFDAKDASSQKRAGGANAHMQAEGGGRKRRPRVAGGGENLPLEVVRCLSEWLAVLEERGCVPGNPLGGMYGCLASFEDSLSSGSAPWFLVLIISLIVLLMCSYGAYFDDAAAFVSVVDFVLIG